MRGEKRIRKPIIFGSLLAVFLIVMIPNVSAIEHLQVKQSRELSVNYDLEKLSEEVTKYPIVQYQDRLFNKLDDKPLECFNQIFLHISTEGDYSSWINSYDDPGYWICKNSWGLEYDEGWFNIAYGECSIEKKSFYLDGVYGQFPILYVDDDNINGPWIGSEQFPFKNIQDGINNAYGGWTVFVKNGLYNENIIINKTINLDGENKETTVIDGGGQGHVIIISASNVRVSGFTIQNSGKKPFEAGIKTLSLYSNATIQNNILRSNEMGIFLNYAYTEFYGKLSWNIIMDNILEDNTLGMYIHWSDNNDISRNIFRNNIRSGMELEAARGSIIEHNIFQDQEGYGLYLRSGSNKNTIQFNDFIDNEIQAYFDGSLHNKWKNNYWSDSRWIILKPIRGQLDIRDVPWINFELFPHQNEINNICWDARIS
jgi:parallel beta-helix repeat protein